MRARRVPPPSACAAWAYFLDVDGTLVNIVERPQAVDVDSDLLDLIARLQAASGGAVALVSGRQIADLQDRLGALQLPLAGLHGLERRDSVGRLWIHAAPPEAKCAIKEKLAPVLARHAGLLLEDKGLTLAVHYRAAPALAAYVHRLMAGLLATFGAGMELQRGKRVLEIKPAGVDKGTAIAEYLNEPPFAGRRPVFIGDDVTDEQGFACVNARDGVSIKVGRGTSCARYRLSDVAAVRHWLGEALNNDHAAGKTPGA